jgi:hypothetical protein
LVVHFIAAFNAGDMRRLDTLFAWDDHDGNEATPSFQWYSTIGRGQRLGAASHDRSTLIPYFARRHAAHERLTLLEWSGGGMYRGYAGFGFRLIRTARDIPRPATHIGKGSAICTRSGPKLAVWSM